MEHITADLLPGMPRGFCRGCQGGFAAHAQDGLIHKDEFALALFKLQGRENLFTDRVFKTFDSKRNDVIDFEEFVRALSVFHPKAPLEEKAECARSHAGTPSAVWAALCTYVGAHFGLRLSCMTCQLAHAE
jgi:hypothetical protein